ncbi:anoctamin [Caerostris extrusa]|uniref:Anoctamin n=1 Tax=Caerostris extrusa TaxID=172846 RepID=A0AAV4RF59_CAEEX|nr:anoctamin [Caerostris extrusa]
MIQYGYLVLFAASFPLAPALALIFNVIDFRIDSRRLLWWNQRPTPHRDNDIAFNSQFGRGESLHIKFAIIIGFEHFIFLFKFIISLIIPDVPTWVKNSQKEGTLLTYLFTETTEVEDQ